MDLKVNDVVRLLIEVPDFGLVQGSIGVVVAVLDAPEKAYEVEFCDSTGYTLTENALCPSQIEYT